MPNLQITGISHVDLSVTDLAASKVWYGEFPDRLASRHGWAKRSYLDDDDMSLITVQALVITPGESTAVVDTYVGNDKQRNIRRGTIDSSRSSGVPAERRSTPP